MQKDELVYWLEKFVCDYCGVYPDYYESDYYEYSDSTKNITTCELKKYNIDGDFIVDLFCEGLDFRYTKNGWDHRSFVGSKWNYIKKLERQMYLKNAYRVLLTRARQGMVIVIPYGNLEDPTRNPDFYDPIFKYLKSIGFKVLE